MKKSALLKSVAFLVMILLYTIPLYTQEIVSWLNDYTSEMIIGSYVYKYNFITADNNACKLKIDEIKTDKKGASSVETSIVYLSDIDPASVSFKTSGSSVIVNIGIKQSQKFVTVLENDVLDGYSNSISVYMTEIDKARSFIDAIKIHSEDCKEISPIWSSRQEAFAWLSQNIGESVASGTSYKQTFVKGNKEYLATLNSESTDSKGVQETIQYNFNLSDIDPSKINLVVSGKYFKIEIPVRDSKYYMQLIKGENTTYSKELEIYSDDMEQARNIYNAMAYLVSETPVPKRKEWENYSAVLAFVKSAMHEVQVGSYTIAQEFSNDESSSGMGHVTIRKTDSKGATTEETNSFYLTDIQPDISLDASSKNISLELTIKDKKKYIKQTGESGILSYTYDIEIFQTGVEEAREMINALESAIAKSTSGVIEFTSADKAIQWLGENTGEVVIDATTIKQSIQVTSSNENKIELQVVTSSEGSTSITEVFEIYPEDIVSEKLEIEVSGKKLWVTLSTGKLKYIKTYKNNILQNYAYETDVFFDDVLKAKNFIAAIKLLRDKSQVSDRAMADKATAFSYIMDHMGKIEIDGSIIEQKFENRDNDNCKMNYIRTVTDSKGVATEYKYEFTLSDIDQIDSKLYITGKELQVKLETKDNAKLIKPYKNSEAENFIYTLDILVNDVLIAKKLLVAFITLSKMCE